MTRAETLLWAGTVLGLSLAVASLTARAHPRTARSLPAGVVASVNGQLIPKADFDAQLAAAIGAGEGAKPGAAEHAAVERLVEEELMLQHGLALGMVRTDLPTRHALLDAVFAAERARGEARQPSDDELTRFYERIAPELATQDEHGTPVVPPLAQIRARVLDLYHRQAGDDAFQASIAALRKSADIRIAEPLR
jgi:hypothetical protein